MADKSVIRGILQLVNDAWRTFAPGDVAHRIREYFAADAVIVSPNLARVARGHDTVSQSYDDLISGAKILRAQLDDPEIDVIAAGPGAG